MKLPYFDSTKPFPKSHDGTPAVRCDFKGNPSPMGRFIKWEEMDHSINSAVPKMAKLLYPEIKIEPINYEELNDACNGGDPSIDLKDRRVERRLKNRLLRVYGDLGLNYLDATKTVIMTPKVETACWAKAIFSDKEYVLINPYLVRYGKKEDISWILRHEFMHRALYRGRSNLKNAELRNIVLDVCINAVLARDDKNGQVNKYSKYTCQWIYPQESKESLIALCNCAIEATDMPKMPPLVRRIWHEVYGDLDSRKTAILPSLKSLTPEDLYFRLKNDFGPDEIKACLAIKGDDGGSGQNPFGLPSIGENNEDGNVIVVDGIGKVVLRDPDLPAIAPERSKRLDRDVKRSLLPKKLRQRGSNFSNEKTDFWDNTVRDPEDVDNRDLAEYSKKIKTEKIVEDLVGNIAKDFINGVTHDPYPYILTEEGMMLAALNVCPPKFPFYFNIEGLQGKPRAIIFYDLSPSMTGFMPYMMGLARRLEDIMEMSFTRNNAGDSGKLKFAGSVQELTEREIEDMQRGIVPMGASTSFNAVIEYCNEKIKTADVDVVIIFTDGESDLTNENISLFNTLGKRSYRIYMRPDSYKGPDIQSNLDLLRGDSYQLHVPRTDVGIV